MNRATRPAAAAAAGLFWIAGGLAYAPDAAAAPPTLTGGTSENVPVDLPDGDALTTLPAGTEAEPSRWFRVGKKDPRETVLVGAALQVPGMGTDGFSGAVQAGAKTCSSSLGGAVSEPGGAVVNSGGNAFEGCPTGDAATIELRRHNLEKQTGAKQPGPTLLRVVRVPHVTNLAELPAELPKIERRQLGRGSDGTVTPGTSVAEPAPVRSDTSYRLSITTGQPQFFVVDVDWGQTLMVQTDVAASPEFEAVREKDPQLEVDVIGPALNQVKDGRHDLDSTYSRSHTLVTDPVVWRSYARGGRSSFLAGKHIIAIGVPEAPFGKPVTFTYGLTIDVEGQATGAPQFGPSPGAGPSSSAAGGSSTAKQYAATGLAVAGALMIIASGVVWLRSR